MPLASTTSLHGRFDDSAASAFESASVEELSPSYLQAHRIVAFDNGHWMTRYYDMLRNQLLGYEKQPHVIAVTAPTEGCGATVSAVNLALSFARMSGSNVLVVDANLRAPAIAGMLGMTGRTDKHASNDSGPDMLETLDFGNVRVHLLRPLWEQGKPPSPSAIQRFRTQIERARQRLKPSVVILDVPPMLVEDETIPMVLEADSVVLVMAAGHSTLSDLEVCQTYLGAKKNVQYVLNKSGKHGL